jgi:diguanylate cyclase
MRYPESVEESITYVKQIMPLMAQHSAPMNPVSFTVWYEFIAGTNPRLKAALNQALAEKNVLDTETIEALYRRFILVPTEDVTAQLPLELQRLLANAAQLVSTTETRVEHYGHSLQQFSEKLSSEVTAVPADSEKVHKSFLDHIRDHFNAPKTSSDSITQMLDETQQLKLSTNLLAERLLDSCKEIESLRAEVARVRQDALKDGLTGLINRRGFDETLASLLIENNERPSSLCMLMADIDYFKNINDTYGHLFGDNVIKAIAELLRRHVKGQDTATRYGGEEFAILLPETSLDGARALAETIRAAVAACRIRRLDSDEQIGNLTLSLGVAAYIQGESATDFLARADRALYASKRLGRNRVTAHGLDPVPGPY